MKPSQIKVHLSQNNFMIVQQKTRQMLFLLQLLYNNFMKTNFDISIPSIPTKTIKFKIQDIKNTAFGSQRNRFQQNKAFLTKKFVQSFNNFTQKPFKKVQLQDQETQAGSRVVTSDQRTELQYRFMIPEQRKYMLHQFDKYKNYQAPIPLQTKYNRGYSFYKTGISVLPAAQTKQRSFSIENNIVSDNFYFPSKRQHSKTNTQKQQKSQVKPSAIFKNETRTRAYLKQEAHINKLGPGHYFKQEIKKPAKPIRKQEPPQDQIDYKNLHKIISNIVNSQEDNVISTEEQVKKQKDRLDHMFVVDDRDRFGQQKYPIVQHLNVPGPGAYQVKNSIEEKVQKVVVVQEQRRLLKEWFNN